MWNGENREVLTCNISRRKNNSSGHLCSFVVFIHFPCVAGYQYFPRGLHGNWCSSLHELSSLPDWRHLLSYKMKIVCTLYFYTDINLSFWFRLWIQTETETERTRDNTRRWFSSCCSVGIVSQRQTDINLCFWLSSEYRQTLRERWRETALEADSVAVVAWVLRPRRKPI